MASTTGEQLLVRFRDPTDPEEVVLVLLQRIGQELAVHRRLDCRGGRIP